LSDDCESDDLSEVEASLILDFDDWSDYDDSESLNVDFSEFEDHSIGIITSQRLGTRSAGVL
jgi:hypothetical protein